MSIRRTLAGTFAALALACAPSIALADAGDRIERRFERVHDRGPRAGSRRARRRG